MRMPFEVRPDASAEAFLAQIGLDHSEDAGTLLVRDVVERRHDLAILVNGLVDRPAGAQRVRVHRLEGACQLVDPDAQPRPPGIADLGAQPLGERLVQPEVVPPDRGHEVPNHWCATSCATTFANLACCLGTGSAPMRRKRSSKTIAPAFSIAKP